MRQINHNLFMEDVQLQALDLTRTSYQNLRDFDAKLRMIINEKIQDKIKIWFFRNIVREV